MRYFSSLTIVVKKNFLLLGFFAFLSLDGFASGQLSAVEQSEPDFEIISERLKVGDIFYFSTVKSVEKFFKDQKLQKAWNQLAYRNIEINPSDSITYMKTAYFVKGATPYDFRDEITLSANYINSTLPGVTYLDPYAGKKLNSQVAECLRKKHLPAHDLSRVLITKKSVNKLCSVKNAFFASEFSPEENTEVPPAFSLLLESDHGYQQLPARISTRQKVYSSSDYL